MNLFYESKYFNYYWKDLGSRGFKYPTRVKKLFHIIIRTLPQKFQKKIKSSKNKLQNL